MDKPKGLKGQSSVEVTVYVGVFLLLFVATASMYLSSVQKATARTNGQFGENVLADINRGFMLAKNTGATIRIDLDQTLPDGGDYDILIVESIGAGIDSSKNKIMLLWFNDSNMTISRQIEADSPIVLWNKDIDLENDQIEINPKLKKEIVISSVYDDTGGIKLINISAGEPR